MKKLFAVLAVLAATSVAQAQGLSDHPDARNDRTPSMQAAEHGHAYRRAEHHHMKHHRKHHHHRHHHG